MYTKKEIRLLPEAVNRVLGGQVGEEYSMEGVIASAIEKHGDKKESLKYAIYEYLLNCPIPITMQILRDLKVDDILYTTALDQMPLYLNRDKEEPEILQEIVATWRIYLGK